MRLRLSRDRRGQLVSTTVALILLSVALGYCLAIATGGVC